MELQHLNVKVFLDASPGLDLWNVVPVFHSWIQDQGMEELLIDVADYRHVRGGPGIVLIGHQADYSLDCSDNRLGIRYNRKAVVPGTNQDRLRQACRAVFTATQKLAADTRLNERFWGGRREMKLFVNDRLLAPNAESSYASVEPEVTKFFTGLFGSMNFTISREKDPRQVFGLSVLTDQDFNISRMLEYLS